MKKKTLVQKIKARINCKKDPIFLRKDFNDLADYDQVGRALLNLVKQKKIIRVGYGLYAKAAISPISGNIIPRTGLINVAKEALKKLNVDTAPSSMDIAYNSGNSTQVPTGCLIGVKSRISRKIGYQGKYVYFEKIAS
jgi:hypothetical protein